MNVIKIGAGHNPDGKVACGAVGYLKESTEARIITNEVIRLLWDEGKEYAGVENVTVDDGISQKDILEKQVRKCNLSDFTNPNCFNIIIHLNAGGGTGCEAYVWDTDAETNNMARKILKNIASLGFKNRGVKVNKDLYVIKNTRDKTILLECCFVDNQADASLYDAFKMARAIASALDPGITEIKKTTPSAKNLYRVQIGAFAYKENAENLLAELRRAGFDGFIRQ